MDWFDSSDDVVIQPRIDRARFWRRNHGVDCIDVAERLVYANNGHGRLFDAVCRALDHAGQTATVHDQREQGYCHYRTSASEWVTVYRAPEPAPYAAADLEFLISAGARQIVFVNASRTHTWDGTASARFEEGVQRVSEISARLFS